MLMIALKNLWRRKVRTLLTTLGVAVGVAAVMTFSAFGEGLANGFQQLTNTSGADLQVGQKDALMIILSAVDEEVGNDLRRIPGVSTVVGTVVGLVQMPESPYFVVLGEDPRGFAIQHYLLREGSSITGRRQIMLGVTAARTFKKGVGDTFRINGFGYKVVGVYETGLGFEDGGAVMHLEDAQRAFERRDQVSYFSVKVNDLRRIEEVRDAIEAHYDDLTVTRSGEASSQDDMLNMYRSMGWFLGAFAQIVGGLGLMNAMMMSVFERTREIGVLRAVGWRRRRIVGMIMGESLGLALFGGLVGIALGYGLVGMLALSPAVEPILSNAITPTIVVQAIVTALVLGTIGGVYPAWRAAQLAPVEAMRQESGVGVQWGPFFQMLTRRMGGTLRNLVRRPTRTLSTALGLGIGVGFVVMLIGVANGATAGFVRLLSAGQADLIGQQANVSDASLSFFDERIAERIKVQPGVKGVSKLLFGSSATEGAPFFIVYGLDPKEEYISRYRVQEGRSIQRSGEIMIGRFVANSMEKGVGDRIQLGGSNYTIVGIYENGAAYEDSGSVLLLKDAQRLFGKPRQISFMGISLYEPQRAAEMARQLEARFPDTMISPSAEHTRRMQDFATMDAMMGALVLLAMVVGGIVMMNVMVMSVFERTQEIGVLRALGWRRGRVLRMILAESLLLSILSAIAGIALGVSLGWAMTLIPGFGSVLTPVFTVDVFAQALAMALSLGALGGLYPAWRAANLRPIEALRYE